MLTIMVQKQEEVKRHWQVSMKVFQYQLDKASAW